MLVPPFSAVEVAREHLNRRLDAAKIGVCSIVNTDVADCLLSRYCLAAQVGSGRKLLACKRSFFVPLRSGPASLPQSSAQMARSIGDKVFGATSLSSKQLARCSINSWSQNRTCPVPKCSLLKARMIIHAYNEHVRLLPHEPWSLNNHRLFGSRGSRHCYAS
jgi:hypothetical protein